jgi:Lrp/AsnC family transcriptional regulator, regulator for asnA, asnC and gidA
VPADLDALDWKLIHLLGHDAADPDRVADELGCERAEVRRRVDRLRGEGFIQEVVARIAPARVGLPVTAFYTIRVAQNQVTYDAVEKMIRDIDQVEEAHAVSGQYDWLVKVRAESVDDLQHLLTNRLALLPGFVRAETMVVLTTACDRVNVHAATHPPES